MKVRILTEVNTPLFGFDAGAEPDLDEERAGALIEAGQAEAIEKKGGRGKKAEETEPSAEAEVQ